MKRGHTRQSGSNRVPSLVDEYARVVIEPDQATVLALNLFLCPNHNCVSDVSSSDFVRDAQTG
jgi:hypothetical protein